MQPECRRIHLIESDDETEKPDVRVGYVFSCQVGGVTQVFLDVLEELLDAGYLSLIFSLRVQAARAIDSRVQIIENATRPISLLFMVSRRVQASGK
jgi:hypothetical protein